MSKSLGNVVLAKDFYRQYGANVFRYLILSSHYSQVINFNEQLIQQALEYIKKITNLQKRLNFFLYLEKKTTAIVKKESKLQKEVIEHLSNNFNTVKVIHLLNETISFLNKSIDVEENNYDFEEKINDFNFILDILGFKFDLRDYNVSTRLLIKK
jgi:cysteinyl-tRNA synthetase